jgi:hypothetical protein
METLLGVVIAAVPLAALVAVLVLVERGQTRRRAEILQQIALTDALHARLGAAVAPVVRRLHRRWQIAVAVPFERPAVVAGVLTTVDKMFGRVAYEVLLSRQAAAPQPRARRTTALGRESLSWT